MSTQSKDGQRAAAETDSIAPALESYNASGGIDRGAAHVFAFVASAWLAILATPLTFFPRFLALLLALPHGEQPQADGALRALNSVETYLANLSGLSFYTIAALLILQTGTIPLNTSLATDPSGRAPTAQAAPFRQPTCFLATAFLTLLAHASWSMGMRFITLTNSVIAAGGVYVVLFGGDSMARGRKSSLLFKSKPQ